MNFVLLEPEEFRKFANSSPWKSFYQTPEIAKLREENGWTAYYFGVEDQKEIIAASMIVARPAFLGKSVYYAPGGPLIDFENTSLVDFFFKHLKKYLKSHNGYVLHIEPYYELVERDRHGALLPDGFNHQKAIQNLRRSGFIALPHSDEPKYAFVMNINGRASDQILMDFKRNTRNHVRKAERAGVKIRELKREELDVFKKITESTSVRRNFTDKPLSYYQKMYDLFASKGEVKFILAEAPVAEAPAREISAHKNSATEAQVPEATSSKASAPEAPVSEGKRSSKATPLVPMSAAMFMLYGDEVLYLFSGSDQKYMKEYNAQYLIQWHMIKYAADHGFKRYNFYGIQGLPDKSSQDYGIYDFKKGFTSEETGRVTELIGAYELPVNSIFYHLHRLLSNLRHH